MEPQHQSIQTQQARFIVAFLTKGNIEQACRSAKIGKTKAYGWLNETGFVEELSRRRAAMVDNAMELLQAASVEAVERLRELLNCGKEAVECRAAVEIIQASLKAKELQEIERRLTALEELAEKHSRENNYGEN